jgi:hypothetical protein
MRRDAAEHSNETAQLQGSGDSQPSVDVSLGVLPGLLDGALIMALVVCIHLVYLSILLIRGSP